MKVGQVVDTPARGYGTVVSTGVTVEHLGTGLVGVHHGGAEKILYYAPWELVVVN